MSIFSFILRKTKSVLPTVDERIITPAFLNKHDIEIRHLINDKWAAWLVGKSTIYRGGEALDRTGVGKWSSESNVAEYAWCDTREEALLSAVRYLAAKGVTIPTPEPTDVTVSLKNHNGLTVAKLPTPTVTPLPKPVPHTGGGIDVNDLRKPEPPHGGGTIPADW